MHFSDVFMVVDLHFASILRPTSHQKLKQILPTSERVDGGGGAKGGTKGGATGPPARTSFLQAQSKGFWLKNGLGHGAGGGNGVRLRS